MKKYLHKILCLTLIFIFMFSFTVFADDDEDEGPSDFEDEGVTNEVDFSGEDDTTFDDTAWTIEYEDGSEEEYVPNPKARWQALSSVVMVLEFKTAGKACFSTAISTKGTTYKIKVITKLQSYRDGRWKTLYTKTKKDTSGTINASSYYVTKGYKYRTHNIITVYDSSWKEIETDILNCTRTYK
jgi:hypothetical protein